VRRGTHGTGRKQNAFQNLRPRSRNHNPENRPAHNLIAENFTGWISAVRECVDQMSLPAETDHEALATYVLAVMEGAVMLSRSCASVEPFDRTIPPAPRPLHSPRKKRRHLTNAILPQGGRNAHLCRTRTRGPNLTSMF
jgi:hypothetical protein